jgi:YD repeat-containing protein
VAGPVRAKVTDPLTHTTLYQLDSQARPLEEDAADGGIWKWARDGDGRVTVATDALSRVTTYTRDPAGYVTQELLPDGNSLTSAYQGAFHALTLAVDERGNSTS